MSYEQEQIRPEAERQKLNEENLADLAEFNETTVKTAARLRLKILGLISIYDVVGSSDVTVLGAACDNLVLMLGSQLHILSLPLIYDFESDTYETFYIPGELPMSMNFMCTRLIKGGMRI